MSVTVTRRISIFFNSDPAAGSIGLSTDGSTFNVALSPPIKIPRSAIACEVYVPQASIWNTSPNISSDFKNNIFTFTTSVAPAGTYTITFPQGLYSLDDIGAYISAQLVNLTLPSNLFTFTGNGSTGQTVITFLTSGDSINFTVANSIGGILGFNPAVITAPSANYSAYSNNVASLNRNDSYLISGTFLSSGGIPVNNNGLGIMASVPINVQPGSLINYQSQIPISTPADELIGALKTGFQFRLTNQSLQQTPTGGGQTTQFWQFVLVIKYVELIKPEDQRRVI
jgi:hypothetical protein